MRDNVLESERNDSVNLVTLKGMRILIGTQLFLGGCFNLFYYIYARIRII